MDHFDEMIKAKAKGEAIDVPVGFCERMDVMTENLVHRKRRRRRSVSFVALAAVVALMITTSVMVFATPIGVQMTEGAISYFNAPKEFKHLSKQVAYEKYNSSVDIGCEDKGIRLNLDNIAVDDNYINVFYTLESEDPIKLLGDEETPMKWRLQWTAVHFWFKADGKYISPAAQNETEGYLVDEYTMKGMQRFALTDHLGDNFDLAIYTNNIWDKEGQWHMAVNVDKSSVAVESNTVMPNQKAKVTSGWGDKTTTHDITVKKVSISPFGAQVVLSERGENIFDYFALRDDKGRYLTVIPAAISSHMLFKVDNSFEFISPDKDIESITILPILSDYRGEIKNVPLKELPLKFAVNNFGGYLLEDLTIDEEKMVAVLQQDGPVSIHSFDLMTTDEGGKILPLAGHVDYDYDRETGKLTVTNYWNKGVTKEDLNKIKGLSYYENRDFELNEKEAITIELNK